MTKRLIQILAITGMEAMFMIGFATAAAKNLGAGETWIINETHMLTELSIADGAAIKVPDGYSLTMTVDGVETPIQEGMYTGNVVLTVNKAIIVNFNGMGTQKKYIYRAAVYVNDGVYVPEKSVEAAVIGGTVTNASAKDVNITSAGEAFNGIIVAGDAKVFYSITNPVIKMTGNGVNDFAGYGAAIMTDGNAEVTIENAKINNTGVVRTAVWVGGNSIARINNSEIETHNGTMPKDYSWSWVKGGGGAKGDVMMEVPWMLGIVGNNRATTVVGNGTAYYNKSHIKAQAWGALSTDQVSQGNRLYAVDSRIETVDSGYGSFADGATNIFSRCQFDVADMALIIMKSGSGVFTDGTVVNSRRFGVMMDGSQGGGGTLTIDKGSVFNTKSSAIQIKDGILDIVVDNAKLNPENGIILQAMENDDPHASSASGGPGSGTAGSPPSGAGGRGEATASRGGIQGGAGGGNLTATFSNATLKGDIVTSMTGQRDLIVHLKNASITGAITTAAAEHAVGSKGEKLVMQDKTDLYYLIGDIKETYCSTDSKYGLRLSLDSNSTWTVNKTSYLTSLTIAGSATVKAPKGYSVTMTVNGTQKPMRAGTYTGKIVLTVIK